jgi:non-homologous end joining protein Ku
VEGQSVVETPEAHIAPVIDIMEALKKSLEARKPPKTATSAVRSSAGEEESSAVSEEPKRKRAARKVKTA